MVDGGTSVEHVNEVSLVDSIIFTRELGWPSYDFEKFIRFKYLKFDDVVSVILNKNVCRETSGETTSSRSVLNVEGRCIAIEREQNHGRSKSRDVLLMIY